MSLPIAYPGYSAYPVNGNFGISLYWKIRYNISYIFKLDRYIEWKEPLVCFAAQKN